MKTFTCLHCNKENTWVRSHSNKYCNNTCQNQFQFLTKTLTEFLEGKIHNRRTQIKCLTHLHGYRCILCRNNGEYNGMKLTLQLDHINGDASDHSNGNLRLLCPNCHSQTDTFGNKNKGKGRASKGLPLY